MEKTNWENNNVESLDIKDTITIQNTSFLQDSRLNYMLTTILPAVEKYMSEEIARQKISGTLTYEQETNLLVQEMRDVVTKYSQNFLQVTEMQVDPVKIEAELTEVNIRIDNLQNDPYVKRIEELPEYKAIVERQEKLAKYYQQIEAQKPKYAEWQQPLGGHDAYNIPSKVLWNGKVWETTINANVWAPNVTGWKEVIK